MSNNDDPLRAQMDDYQRRATEAQAKAAQAYSRLLERAETSDSGQARRIARFIAATYNGHAFTFDLFDLRAMDVEISDDMLICLDALRWGREDLYRLVPDGSSRIKAVIDQWDLRQRSAEASD